MSDSLRIRLLGFSAVFIGLALVVVWVALNWIFSQQLAVQHDRYLSALADTLAANIEEQESGWTLTRLPADPRFEIPASAEYWQVEENGAVVLRSQSLWDERLDLAGAEPMPGTGLLSIAGPFDARLIVHREMITLGESEPLRQLTLLTATSRSDLDASLADFSSTLAIMLAITGTALVAASAMQTTLGLAPLGRLRSDINDVRTGKASRVSAKGPIETGLLVQEVNELLAAREDAVERARARASDLAHGLKTPLTILSNVAERMEASGSKEAADEIQEQILAIRSRVDRQLALARMGMLRGSKCDAGKIIARLAGYMGKAGTGGNGSKERSAPVWKTNAPESFLIAGDENDFVECLGNIFDNAGRWARTEVLVEAVPEGAGLTIKVSDDGPGVGQDNIARIAERGARFDTLTSQNGLGLAISRELAEAHGGRLEFATAPSAGLVVTLFWPAVGFRPTAGDGSATAP